VEQHRQVALLPAPAATLMMENPRNSVQDRVMIVAKAAEFAPQMFVLCCCADGFSCVVECRSIQNRDVFLDWRVDAAKANSHARDRVRKSFFDGPYQIGNSPTRRLHTHQSFEFISQRDDEFCPETSGKFLVQAIHQPTESDLHFSAARAWELARANQVPDHRHKEHVGPGLLD
jgi:hypothetical protein